MASQKFVRFGGDDAAVRSQTETRLMTCACQTQLRVIRWLKTQEHRYRRLDRYSRPNSKPEVR